MKDKKQKEGPISLDEMNKWWENSKKIRTLAQQKYENYTKLKNKYFPLPHEYGVCGEH